MSISSSLKSDFNFIEINCLRLQSPVDIYTALWRGMTGCHLNAKAALKQIKQYIDAGVNSKKPEDIAKRECHVVLVDEIDFLLTKDEAAIYHFFDWPLHANSRLILISISNTFDLANRLSQRVQSRVSSVMRLLFAPYTYTEIGLILTKRLDDLAVYFPQPIFDKVTAIDHYSLYRFTYEHLLIITQDGINLLSRKAANVAGDLRAALKICQKAIEILRDEVRSSDSNQSTHPKVTSSIISRAAEEYKENPMIVMLQNSCKLDTALILSLCKHFNVTGSMECKESELWDRLADLIFSVKGNPLIKPPLIQPPYYIFLTCIQRLAAMGYIQVSTTKANATGSSQYKVQLITLKMEVSEIKSTLMGSGDLLVEYGGFNNI